MAIGQIHPEYARDCIYHDWQEAKPDPGGEIVATCKKCGVPWRAWMALLQHDFERNMAGEFTR